MRPLNNLYFMVALLGFAPTSGAFSYVPADLTSVTREASLCEESSRWGRFSPTEEWIRAHMRVGFERTYSNDILDGLLQGPDLGMKLDLLPANGKRIQGDIQLTSGLAEFIEAQLQVYSTITAEQAREVTRFLVEVLGARDVEFFLHYPAEKLGEEKKPIVSALGFEPHLQSFSFFLHDRDGRALWVTLEPGCIEVNQAPVAIAQVEEVWASIEERAAASGFVGTIHEGGHGGGATHMHWGWNESANNLWAARPDLSSRVLMLPLRYRFLMYILGEIHDQGPGSTARLPWEIDNEDIAEYLHYNLFLSQAANTPMTLEQRLDWIDQNRYFQGDEHDRAVSLAHFNGKNPRFELRFIRSLSNCREMALVAELWLRTVVWLLESTDFVNFEPRAYDLTDEWSLIDMLDDAETFFKKLKFSDSEVKELLSLGGWPTGQPSSISLRNLDPRFGDVKFLYGPKRDNGSERVELRIPVSDLTQNALHLDVTQSENISRSRRGDSWIMRLQCRDFQVSSTVIVFRDADENSLRVVATCDARDPNRYRLSFGESLAHALKRRAFGDEFAPPVFAWNLLNSGDVNELEAREKVVAGGSLAESSSVRLLRILDTDGEGLRQLALAQAAKPLTKFWIRMTTFPEDVLGVYVRNHKVPFKIHETTNFKIIYLTDLTRALGADAFKKKISFVVNIRIKNERLRLAVVLDRDKGICTLKMLPALTGRKRAVKTP